MMTFPLEEIFSSIHRIANVLPIESLSVSSRFGEHKSLFKGDGHDFDQKTEYDPQVHSLSQIDWLSMTRDKVFVREFRVTKEFPVLLLGDLSASMLFGIDHQLKERMFLEVMGDIGLACFHAQDPMGFVGFGEDIIFNESPKIGEDHTYYLMEQVYNFFDGMTSDGRGGIIKSGTNFCNAFDFLLRTYIGSRHFIIVVSDFIGIEHLPSLQFLDDISSQHEVVFLFLDDPLEFSINTGLGLIKTENIETGQSRTVTRNKFRKEGMRVRRQRREFRNHLQEIGIDSMVLEYGKHFQRLHRFFDARSESFKG